MKSLSPFSNRLAFLSCLWLPRSGKLLIYLNANIIMPAFDCNNLLRKLLWVALMDLLTLNLLIISFSFLFLLFFKRFSNILMTNFLLLALKLLLSFYILLSSLHLLNESPKFPLKTLNIRLTAFSLTV